MDPDTPGSQTSAKSGLTEESLNKLRIGWLGAGEGRNTDCFPRTIENHRLSCADKENTINDPISKLDFDGPAPPPEVPGWSIPTSTCKTFSEMAKLFSPFRMCPPLLLLKLTRVCPFSSLFWGSLFYLFTSFYFLSPSFSSHPLDSSVHAAQYAISGVIKSIGVVPPLSWVRQQGLDRPA